MKHAVAVVLLALFTAGLAAGKTAPTMMVTSGADPCVQPGYQQTVDPAITAIEAQEQPLLARGDFSGAKALESRVQAILLQRMPPQAPAAGPVPVAAPPAMGGSFDPDLLVWSGGISAFGADYEQDADGTMWAVLGWRADTTVRVVRSTDHGATWAYFGGYTWNDKPVARKLDIVVGMGDSNFIHVFDLYAGGNGDLWDIRFDRGGGFTSHAVLTGSDTITDFSACRDFTSPYFLYGEAHNEMAPGTPVGRIFRSTDFGVTWAVTNTVYNTFHPHMSFGAGAWGYLACAPDAPTLKGYVGAVFSNDLWAPGAIAGRSFRPDTFRVWDAVIAPEFTMPETSAIAYAAYTHNFMGTSDWDVLYSWWDSTATWHGPYYASGSSSLGEGYVDLKNYTVLGNSFIDLTYGTWTLGVTSYGPVYMRWANAATPGAGWSDSIRISQSAEAYCDWQYTPKLVYSPNGPGSGGGAVFADNQSPSNLYFNAPWHTGVAESRSLPPRVVAFSATPTVAHGPVRLTWAGDARQVTVTDVAGRVLRTFARPAGNSLVWDGKAPAGTYFCRVVTAEGAATKPVIIQ